MSALYPNKKLRLCALARRHLPIGLRRFGWRIWLRDLAHACIVVLFTALVATAFSTLFIHPWR